MKKLIVLIILLFAFPALGADHYFDADATDDSGAGTSGDPWKTLSKAHDECGTGDTCYFDNQDTWYGISPMLEPDAGEDDITYDGASWGGGGAEDRAEFQANGPPADSTGNYAAMVHFVNVDEIVFKGFELDGDNQHTEPYDSTYSRHHGMTIGSYNTTGDFENITIENVRIHDFSRRGLYIGSQGYASSKILSNIRITNVHVYDIKRGTKYGGNGFSLYPAWNTNISIVDRVEDIIFTDCKSYNNYRLGFYFKCDIDDVILQDSESYNNGYDGLSIDVSNDEWLETNPQSIIVRRNKFYNNGNSGIYFQNGPQQTLGPLLFYNNLVYNNGSRAVNFQEYDYDNSDIRFYNNTFYTTTIAGMIYSQDDVGSAATVIFQNNIFYSTNGKIIDDDAGRIQFSDNLYYRASGSGDTHVDYGGVEYDRSETASWDNTSQTDDPDFVNATTDLSVNAGSDAIDNGADLSGTFTDDYNETTRPQNEKFDIGAYEYGASTPSNSIQGVKIGTSP